MNRLVALALVLGACASYDWAQRREMLLTSFPPGTTTRADVERAAGRATISRERDSSAWTCDDYVCLTVRHAEQRTNAKVYRVERYQVPDGFFSLAYDWFFYDAQDVVLDAEWQYSSD